MSHRYFTNKWKKWTRSFTKRDRAKKI